LQPIVIRQGDYLAKLAYKFGFDADTVWNDPKNAQLRQAGRLSQDPNILRPTDMLYIPDSTPPTMHNVITGTTNTFVANVPTVMLTVTFTDQSLASQAYVIQELPDLAGLSSGADGTVSFSAPATLKRATIVFADSGAMFECNIGHLDPIRTLSGVFQRLQNLGFIEDDAVLDDSNREPVREALRAFKAAQSPPDSSPQSASSTSSGDGVQGPASSPDASPNSEDDSAGLNDDGELDDETTKMLLDAHGS
jgi:hypothetical protein